MQGKPSRVLVWLRRDRLPGDLYELLGVARLDLDAEGLRGIIREANRELLALLGDADSKLSERAARLQTELAQADRILADPARLRAYEARLVRALRDSFVEKHGDVRGVGAASKLRVWLEQRIHVHPARVDAVMRAMGVPQEPRPQPASAAAPDGGPDPAVPQTLGSQDDPLGGWRPPVEKDPIELVGRSQRGSRRRRRVLATAGAVGGAIAVGVGSYVALLSTRSGNGTDSVVLPALTAPSTETAQRSTAQAAVPDVESKQRLVRERHPLDLRLLPAGSRLLVAVRPARLMSDSAGRDVVRGLGPWADAGLDCLRRLIQLDAADVDQVVVGLIPGAPDAPPDRAAVVRLTHDARREDVLERFGHPEPRAAFSETYFTDRSTKTAYYFADSRTIAILPPQSASEVLRDVRTPLPTSPDVEALVEYSDRDWLLNVVFDVRFLREAARALDAENYELVTRGLDLLGEEAAAGLLSLDTGELFQAGLVVRGRRDVRPSVYGQSLEGRLRLLPYDLLHTVQTMRPSSRARRLVGRFPAMVKALALVLEVKEDAGSIVARARLPERAGPNLALAGRLTWEAYHSD